MSVTCVINREKYAQLRSQLQQFQKSINHKKKKKVLQTFLLLIVSFFSFIYCANFHTWAFSLPTIEWLWSISSWDLFIFKVSSLFSSLIQAIFPDRNVKLKAVRDNVFNISFLIQKAIHQHKKKKNLLLGLQAMISTRLNLVLTLVMQVQVCGKFTSFPKSCSPSEYTEKESRLITLVVSWGKSSANSERENYFLKKKRGKETQDVSHTTKPLSEGQGGNVV